MVETYRSYVIRVRRRNDLGDSVHLDVEDLFGGRRVALNGDAARTLADRLTDMVASADEPAPGEAIPPDDVPGSPRRPRRASPPSGRR